MTFRTIPQSILLLEQQSIDDRILEILDRTGGSITRLFGQESPGRRKYTVIVCYRSFEPDGENLDRTSQ